MHTFFYFDEGIPPRQLFSQFVNRYHGIDFSSGYGLTFGGLDMQVAVFRELESAHFRALFSWRSTMIAAPLEVLHTVLPYDIIIIIIILLFIMLSLFGNLG